MPQGEPRLGTRALYTWHFLGPEGLVKVVSVKVVSVKVVSVKVVSVKVVSAVVKSM